MRWQGLFGDLEGQFAAAEAEELAAEVSDRTRGEAARLRLRDRLLGSTENDVVVGVTGTAVRGRLSAVGADWLLLTGPAGQEALLPLAAVASVTGLGRASAAPGGGEALAERLPLTTALRALARDRAPVTITLVDGSVLIGTIDRVGADFLELAEHRADEFRRAGAVRAIRTVAIAAVTIVRSS